MKLSKPASDKATVLYHLIKHGSVSMKTFSWMEGYRTRISELRRKHNIALSHEMKKASNRFGRTMYYYRHTLLDKAHAIEIYKTINRNK